MTTPVEWRTVWILGSGFSKPLGGPLLPQLLSHAAFQDAHARYPHVFQGVLWEATVAVWYLYHYGTRFEQGTPPMIVTSKEGESLWAHAEEFLGQLDAAVIDDNGAIAKQIARIVQGRSPGGSRNVSPSDLRAAARRIVGIQCTSFAQDGDLSSERWRPFKDWVASLSNSDTIITFNYDPVLEKLNEDRKLNVVIPAQYLKPSEPDTKLTDVFKLHGSVNWKQGADKKIVAVDQLDFVATCAPNELAIATPGASKHTDVTSLFMSLWALAEYALVHAHEVIFIGYKFPPSDAYSRERLLRALWRNTEPDLRTSIVLGPNVHHEDVVRLEKMLDWTIESSATARLKVAPDTIPLFAEDYLTIWRLDPATRSLRGRPDPTAP